MAESDYRILVDGSGSMAESGKRYLVSDALALFRALLDNGLLPSGSVRVFVLSSDIGPNAVSEADFDECCGNPERIPSFSGSGIDHRRLKVVLNGCPPGSRVLFLTDGFWDATIGRALLEWTRTGGSDSLRILRIGALPGASVLSGSLGSRSFDIAELLPAVDLWRRQDGGPQ